MSKMEQEHREYEGLPGPSNRGIVVDESKARETYPLRGTSIMDTLSFGKTTQQITNVKDKTSEQLLVLEK